MKSMILRLSALLFAIPLVFSGASVTASAALQQQGSYADVNGGRLYYTVSGTGTPVLLIHGNGEDHTVFDTVTKELSAQHRVYAVDSRGHGKSDKVDELNYSDMAADFDEFINTVIGEPTIVYGFSDGGIIALLMAIGGNENLKQIICSGANTHPKGLKWYVYLETKVEYWFKKDPKIKMMLEQPNITAEQLQSITVPAVILAGQFDLIKKSDTCFIAENIPNSIMEILPWQTHGGYVVNSEKLYPILEKYMID